MIKIMLLAMFITVGGVNSGETYTVSQVRVEADGHCVPVEYRKMHKCSIVEQIAGKEDYVIEITKPKM